MLKENLERGWQQDESTLMARAVSHAEKASWTGRIVGVQPRIRLLRSFDQRQHSYQGYVLRIDGTCGEKAGEFLVAVGKGAHEKHGFRAGMELSGQSVPVERCTRKPSPTNNNFCWLK